MTTRLQGKAGVRGYEGDMTDDEALDAIADALALECWVEGKTLTVKLPSDAGELLLAKFRFAGIVTKPTARDLQGEPE